MKQTELASLKDASEHVVGVAELQDRTARTLLYGYTCDRHDWHVYLDEAGDIHCVCYDHRGLLMHHTAGPTGGVERNSEYVPNKRLYPESCDYEFSRLLTIHGVSLPFTTFGGDDAHAKRIEKTGFAGTLVGDLKETVPLTTTDLPVSSEAAKALFHQAAKELGVAAESLYNGALVPPESRQKVLDKAKELADSEDFERYQGDFHHPAFLARGMVELFANYQTVYAHSASLDGATLSAHFSIDGSADYERAAKRYGLTIEALTDRARTVRGEAIRLAIFDTPSNDKSTTQGMLFAHLFGDRTKFDEFVQRFVRISTKST